MTRTLPLSILAAALIMIALGIWILPRGVVHIPLDSQSLQVRMPQQLPVSVEVIDARGPQVKADTEGIPVRLNETLRLKVDFDTEVPLALTVRYQDQIPVKAQVPVDTVMETRILGIPISLPVKGTIPLDLSIPINLTIPIEQPVRLKFTAPITARIDQTVHIPLRAELDARIRFGDAPIALSVSDSELALPLRGVRLGRVQ